MDTADIEIRLSGGASNSDPLASLGGIISSNSPGMQTSEATTISGVTIAEVGGMEDGDATLTVRGTTGLMSLSPAGGYSGLELSYTGFGNTSYMLYGAEGPSKGYMLVDVVEASMPTFDTSEVLAITTVAEGIFPDVTYAQATTGVTQYRCLYIKNVDASISISELGIYLLKQSDGEDTLSYALDTDAGVGDGSTTGIAASLVDETDPTNLLSGLTFDNETDHTQAQLLGSTIIADDCIALWIRRVVPAFVDVETLDNRFAIGIKAYLGA